MPKSKVKEEKIKNKVAPKETEKEEEKELDPDLLLSDDVIVPEIEVDNVEDEDDEEGVVLDDDEVDPFKDKWEE
jgi:hypothetical protein